MRRVSPASPTARTQSAGAVVDTTAMDRRSFLAGGGGLVMSLSLGVSAQSTPATLADTGKGPSPERLDSWLAIDAQGRVLASVGKIDAGLGLPTALAQIVADELEVAFAQVRIRMGDTATTVDQRGTGSSNGITEGGSALRTAAAQARGFLLARAAEHLKVPVEALLVQEGVIRVKAEPARYIGYGDLLRGQRFDLVLDPKAKPVLKDAKTYRFVGLSVPRADIAEKVTARYRYLVDLTLPGMLHARVLRPPTAGAQLLGVAALPATPGFIRLVMVGNFAAVVCEREEQAVAAARSVRLNWSAPTFAFSRDEDALFETLRSAPAHSSKVDRSNGDVAAALKSAARRVEAEYQYPFQSHACMGPACAVAHIEGDQVTVWMGGQKPYPLRKAVAEVLNVPTAKVRVVWLPGPGSYGMNDADDCAVDAALIAREVASETARTAATGSGPAITRPVRLQYSRADATAWDPKGPPGVFRLRGGLDASGRVTAFDYHSRGYSGRTRPSGTDRFGDTLAAQLTGGPKTASTDLFQVSAESYRFDHQRVSGDLIDWRGSLATGLRTAHLRDPDGMATCFASESFIDELALAAKMDPVAFRLQHLGDARHAAVLRAAADKVGWVARVGSNLTDASSGLLRGRGIAYAPRNGAVVAIVAEVEVNPATGHWRATRFVVAHDCGMVINPRSLEGVIESNLLMSLSRTRHEAVRFNEREVLSVDWASYPALDITEVPDAIEVVLVGNTPGRSYGAGEPSTRPVAAALANALFDATGRRLRRIPFTPERVLAALQTPAITA